MIPFQGGECDLQDQSMAFGSDRSRFTGNKRHNLYQRRSCKYSACLHAPKFLTDHVLIFQIMNSLESVLLKIKILDHS